jgi:hypothetical protein
MPGHGQHHLLGVKRFYRELTLFDYMQSYIAESKAGGGGSPAHWPLSDTSFTSTPGSITEVVGGSDGTYDYWWDYGGGFPPLAQQSPLITGGSAHSMTFYEAAGNQQKVWRDQIRLGAVERPTAAWPVPRTATFLIWIAIQKETGNDTYYGEEYFVESSLIYDGNSTPDRIELANSGDPGLSVHECDFAPSLFVMVQEPVPDNSNSTSELYWVHKGNRYHLSAGALWPSAGTGYITCGMPMYSDNVTDVAVGYQDAYWLPSVALTSEQVKQIYTAGTGLSAVDA